MRACWHYCIILTKSSRGSSSQHLPFQSMNNNTIIGCESCSRLIKMSLARQKSLAVVHLLCLNKFYTLFECFYGRFSKRKEMSTVVLLAVFQGRYPHPFIKQPATLLQRTAAKAISKNLKFSFLENNRV